MLKKVQRYCSKLGTITITLHSTNAMELRLDALDCLKIVTKAIALVNTLFRAISSLQDISVEVCEDSPSDHIRREMKSHGWTICATEYVEESGSGFIEDYDHAYDYGDYGDDDHDIEIGFSSEKRRLTSYTGVSVD